MSELLKQRDEARFAELRSLIEDIRILRAEWPEEPRYVDDYEEHLLEELRILKDRIRRVVDTL